MSSFSERLKSQLNATMNNTPLVSTKVRAVSEIQDEEFIATAETWTRSSKYDWYDEFTDENISTVDEYRNIKLDDKQINLSQESYSQFIPFKMPRRYDGFDLALNTQIDFHYATMQLDENGKRKGGHVKAINVQYDADTLKFGLLVPPEMVAIPGDIDFEIEATGKVQGHNYKWISRTSKFKVLASLCALGELAEINPVDPDWYTTAVVSAQEAREAAEEAKGYLTEIEQVVDNAAEAIIGDIADILSDTYYTKEQVNSELETKSNIGHEHVLADITDYKEPDFTGYATETFVKEEIEKVDVSEQLKDYALKSEIPENISAFTNDVGYLTEHQSLEGYATETFVTEAIEQADIEGKLGNYYKKDETYSKEEIDTAIENSKVGYATETFVEEKIAQEDITGKLGNYYTKSEVDTAIENAEPDLTGMATEEYVDGKIQTVNSAIATINQTLDSIDKSPNKTYEALYNDESAGENVFQLIEIVNEGKENEERVVKSQFTIVGGSGGSSSANTIKIERVTNSPLVVTADDKVEIEYNFIGTDASGDDIGQGNVTWKLGNKVIKTETVYTGTNKADLTEYLSVASDQKITLIISDDIGTMQQKTWYVSVVDVKLESAFDDTRKYTANSPVTFTYTPYGAVDKTVHYLLDGREIGTKTSAKGAAGLSDSFSIPAQSHGTHLFEIYMTATVNNNDIESNHIVKDIIWYDEDSSVPVIGTVQQEFTARQYEATNIKYTVYDPSTETPNVTLRATYVNGDGETVETYNSSLTMSSNTDIWQFKTDVMGEHTLTITCGETVKTLKATIVDLGINVSPTTAGLEFDFNPVGYSNNDANRLWKDSNTGVSMTVSDNFDWVNGGYQIDENGDQYFCIKAGTTATINYNLFADDAKGIGKEFKAIFKTSNVKKRDTSFITCMNGGIGLDMKVESANVYSSNGNLYSPYCEEDIIEFEFNINKSDDIPLVLTYEDGVGNRPMIYTSDSSFWQPEPQPITIGCDNCDVYIYRMKAYSTSLSDKDILNNFIADARSAEEMINRYKRNQIYKDGLLNPEYLAEVCPDLRIILIDAPWFTNDKDNKVTDTNITMIYKNGDPILDNWTCTGATHRGQGTSSNEYGYSGRNIDLVMNTDTSLFTLGDGITTSSTITLTRDSVPTNYLNVKVKYLPLYMVTYIE